MSARPIPYDVTLDGWPPRSAVVDEPVDLTPRGHLRAATSEPRWLRIAIAEGVLMLPPSFFGLPAGGGQ